MSCFNNGRRAGGKGGLRESETCPKRLALRKPQAEINANKMTSEVRKRIALKKKRNRARIKRMFSKSNRV